MDSVKDNNLENSSKNMLHKFDSKDSSLFGSKFIILIIVILILGIGSGYLFAKKGTNTTNSSNQSSISDGSSIGKGTVVGSNDTKTFKDSAQGVLKDGGVEGEGQFHLVRPGGDSKNVYMTSSIVDLSKFIDKKIKVWGQTQKAQTAGWLMDVGKVEVLE